MSTHPIAYHPLQLKPFRHPCRKVFRTINNLLQNFLTKSHGTKESMSLEPIIHGQKQILARKGMKIVSIPVSIRHAFRIIMLKGYQHILFVGKTFHLVAGQGIPDPLLTRMPVKLVRIEIPLFSPFQTKAGWQIPKLFPIGAQSRSCSLIGSKVSRACSRTFS